MRLFALIFFVQIVSAFAFGEAVSSDCRAALGQLERNFERMFPGSGFRNLSDLSVKAKRSPVTSAIHDRLVSEDFQVVVRRPEKARDNIAQRGFSTFHESRQSQGDMGKQFDDVETAIERRNLIEASYLYLTPEKLASMPASDHPKYGYLRFSPTEKKYSEADPLSYGLDGWILKRDAIRDRTTMIMGDSIDRIRFVVPKAYRGDGRFVAFQPSSWDQSLIPWNYRTILLPEALPRIHRKGVLGVNSGVKIDGYRKYLEDNDFSGMSFYERPPNRHPFHEGEELWLNGADYIESQTFGKIGLEDVEAFEFGGTPPEGSFLKALQEYQIPIHERRIKN